MEKGEPIFLQIQVQSSGHRGHHEHGHFQHGLLGGIIHNHGSHGDSRHLSTSPHLAAHVLSSAAFATEKRAEGDTVM